MGVLAMSVVEVYKCAHALFKEKQDIQVCLAAVLLYFYYYYQAHYTCYRTDIASEKIFYASEDMYLKCRRFLRVSPS